MGFNTTVIVMNDALHSIENDTEFGKKLATAILMFRPSQGRQDVSSGGHCNAASVIETHHANDTAVVAVGGNYGTVLGTHSDWVHHTPESKEEILRDLAEQMGYRLVKKAKKGEPDD